MRLRFVAILTSLILACAIFTVSIYKGVSPRYAFSPAVLSDTAVNPEDINIDYDLTYPGKILPDSPFWFAKAVRDRVIHLFTFDHQSQADLALTCADKRLQMAKAMFEKGKPDLGMTTLVKAEKYLADAVMHAKELDEGDNSAFFEKTSLSSLKHREIIEENILPLAPEDLKPEIVKTTDYTKNSYKESRDVLRNNGISAPINPFDIE
jgi:hypothetical protein